MPPTPGISQTGIWIKPSGDRRSAYVGPGWDELIVAANSAPTTAVVSNQDSDASTGTMAAAIVCARAKLQSYCDRTIAALRSAATGNPESGGRALRVRQGDARLRVGRGHCRAKGP